MLTTELNVQTNATHYDQRYRSVNVECLVRTINNLPRFLEDAVRTDTSWHGFYLKNFAQQIAGKKVLELGCRTGRMSSLFGLLGAEVVGVDLPNVCLKAAQREADSSIALIDRRPSVDGP